MSHVKPYWFGRNWKQFLDEDYSEERVSAAVSSLRSVFGDNGLTNKTFMDIGCGSGMFSLAALRLGAARVVSMDVDRDSVECCRRLCGQMIEGDRRSWTVILGSILDTDLVNELPMSDVVYAWGVLHHTGNMWRAVENAGRLVRPGGAFVIGIYNWQGGRRGTVTWQKLKKWYCHASRWQSRMWECAYVAWKLSHMMLVLRNPIAHVRTYKQNRGMSWFRDVSDWLGGYPYEAATPGDVLDFVRSHHGFQLVRQRINCGLGVSEFLFTNVATPPPTPPSGS